MINYESPLLADDSHEISYNLIFPNLNKISQNLSSSAAVIGDLRTFYR